MQDLQGRFFEEGDSVAYVGFDNKIHIGKARIYEGKLMLEIGEGAGWSTLGKGDLIID